MIVPFYPEPITQLLNNVDACKCADIHLTHNMQADGSVVRLRAY